MSLKIIAKPSPLPGSSSYIPVILRQPSLDQDQLLEYMAKDTALEKTDMGATLQRFQEALRFFLAKGFRLETCLGSYGLVARGGLESEDAPFRPADPDSAHRLEIQFRPSQELAKSLNSEASIERLAYEGPRGPKITSITNLSQGGRSSFSPGDVLELRGLRLKCGLNTPQEDEGLFWIPREEHQGQGKAYRTPVIIQNTEHLMSAQIPPLPGGLYTLEVRSRCAKVQVRKGSWSQSLAIQS
jgi:hypothetical protein